MSRRLENQFKRRRSSDNTAESRSHHSRNTSTTSAHDSISSSSSRAQVQPHWTQRMQSTNLHQGRPSIQGQQQYSNNSQMLSSTYAEGQQLRSNRPHSMDYNQAGLAFQTQHSSAGNSRQHTKNASISTQLDMFSFSEGNTAVSPQAYVRGSRSTERSLGSQNVLPQHLSESFQHPSQHQFQPQHPSAYIPQNSVLESSRHVQQIYFPQQPPPRYLQTSTSHSSHSSFPYAYSQAASQNTQLSSQSEQLGALYGINQSNSHESVHERPVKEPKRSILNRILSQLPHVTESNFEEFLMTVLNECGNFVPLDDFYNILYNQDSFSSFLNSTPAGQRIDKSLPTENLGEGVKIIQRILEIFKEASSISNDSKELGETSKLASVNFHELLRSFLAMKIMKDSLAKVEGSSSHQSTLPRFSIYKIYYIICQRLILKYPTDSNSTSLQQKLILGQSKLGKLIKLVYPDLIAKRLGKRGESKYNYLGVRWNESIVNDEFITLSQHDIPKLNEIFKDMKKALDDEQRVKFQSQRKNQWTSEESKPAFNTLQLSDSPFIDKPLLSYISKSFRLPEFNFSLSTWSRHVATSSGESSWASKAIENSSQKLRKLGLNVDELIQYFELHNFLDKDPDKLLYIIAGLLNSHISENEDSSCVPLHVFLIVFILAFPLICNLDDKYHGDVRVSINNVVAKLESKTSTQYDSQDIKTGVGVLKRMIRLNLMKQSNVKASHAHEIIHHMRHDLRSLLSKEGSQNEDRSILNNTILLGLVHAYRAYKYEPNFGDFISKNKQMFQFFAEIEDFTTKIASTMLDVMNAIPSRCETQSSDNSIDLPFRIFKAFTLKMHELYSNNNELRLLPVPVFIHIVALLANATQKLSFDEFGKRNAELSKDVFKAWWVLSALLQEYTMIIAEVLALADQLKSDP